MCTFNTLLTKIFAAAEFLFIASYVIYSLGRLGIGTKLIVPGFKFSINLNVP